MTNIHENAAKHLENIVADKEHGAVRYLVMLNLIEQFVELKQKPGDEFKKSCYDLIESYLQQNKLEFSTSNINKIELPELLNYARKGE